MTLADLVKKYDEARKILKKGNYNWAKQILKYAAQSTKEYLDELIKLNRNVSEARKSECLSKLGINKDTLVQGDKSMAEIWQTSHRDIIATEYLERFYYLTAKALDLLPYHLKEAPSAVAVFGGRTITQLTELLPLLPESIDPHSDEFRKYVCDITVSECSQAKVVHHYSGH